MSDSPPRTVAFVLDQSQDYMVSAGYARLLRRRAERHGVEPPAIIALVLEDALQARVARYAEELDAVHLLGSVSFPATRVRPAAAMVGRIRALRRAAGALPLGSADVLVAYSFREFATSVLLRALPARPTLVRIRKCDHASDATLTRKRPLVSLYWNAWSTLFGIGRQRYRWLPSTNRSGNGTFVHDPYDFEFCVGPPGSPAGGGRWAPYPFAALLADSASTAGAPTIVFLGEKYPLYESIDEDAFRVRLNEILAHIRASFPGHRLVFKPRVPVDGLGFDLAGFEVAYEDVLLEDLLLREPGIEKVLSVKSTGSTMASNYGKEGYLLYPMFDFPADFRSNLDSYYGPYAGSVCFAERPEEIGRAPRREAALERLELDAAPLLDLLS